MIDSMTVTVPLAHDQLIGNPLRRRCGLDPRLKVLSPTRSPAFLLSVPGPAGVMGQYLKLSVHPEMFLRGQNIDGGDHLPTVVAESVSAVLRYAGIVFTADEVKRWREGDFQVGSVDIARMVPLGSTLKVRNAIEAIGAAGKLKYRTRVEPGISAVVYGKGSRGSALTFYDKTVQLRAVGKIRKTPPEIHAESLARAAGFLRIEWRGHRRCLRQKRLTAGYGWLDLKGEDVLNEVLKGFSIQPSSKDLSSVAKLPKTQRQLFEAWRAGTDIHAFWSPKQIETLQRKIPHIDLTKDAEAEMRIPEGLEAAIRGVAAEVDESVHARSSELIAAPTECDRISAVDQKAPDLAEVDRLNSSGGEGADLQTLIWTYSPLIQPTPNAEKKQHGNPLHKSHESGVPPGPSVFKGPYGLRVFPSGC